MTFKTRTAVALILAATATHATAQNAPDYYITGALGASNADGWEGNIGVGIAAPITGDFEASPLFRFGVGHDYDGPLRAEVELAYRALDVSEAFTATSDPGTFRDIDGDSDVEVTTLMINGLYDFDLPTSDYVIYVGAGLGMAYVDVEMQRGPLGARDFFLLQGDYTALAGQLRLGVERDMANGMTLYADYTYLHVAQSDYDGFNTFNGNVTQSFSAINSHELAIGVRFGF